MAATKYLVAADGSQHARETGGLHPAKDIGSEPAGFEQTTEGRLPPVRWQRCGLAGEVQSGDFRRWASGPVETSWTETMPELRRLLIPIH